MEKQIKVAIITGANQGLGKEIAKAYAQNSIALMLGARDLHLLEQVKQELIQNSVSDKKPKILVQKLDVSNEQDCKNIVEETLKNFGCVDILVNNAGIYGPKGKIEETNWQDWQKSLEINLFGSIFMIRTVLPSMKKMNRGKIIQLSGGGATNPMPYISSYAVAKAGIVRFIETIAMEVAENNIDINSIAPGALNTRLLDEILEAGPEKVGHEFYNKSLKQQESGGSDFEKACSLALFLASEASNGITGKLISAVWDDYKVFPEHLEELKSDLYTLRRITAKDRNKAWGDK